MSNDTSHAGNCPAKYLKLRNRILKCLEEGHERISMSLRKHLRGSYPRLLAQCYSKPPVANGKNLGRGTLDLLKLYRILNITLRTTCLECEAPAEFCKKRGRYRDFCSVACSANSESTRAKYRRTSKERYGAENFRGSKIGKERIRKVIDLKYGGHQLQNPEVFERVQKNRYATKEFISRKGSTHSYQGYEGFVLTELDTNSMVLGFTTVAKKIPRIRYEEQGKHRVYYPDILIKLRDGRKILTEVKSTYTLSSSEEVYKTNLLKFASAEAYCLQNNQWEFWLALTSPKGEITWIRNPSNKV